MPLDATLTAARDLPIGGGKIPLAKPFHGARLSGFSKTPRST